jgi:voltage-gated sodium channel
MANHRQKLGEFLESDKFQHFIISLIVLNSITIGMETSKSLMASYAMYFDWLDHVILAIFVIEVVLKLYAFGFRFFINPWNVFDFAIVAVSLVPTAGAFSVFRTLRILRTLRLIKNIPKLRMIIEALAKSIPSIGWIMILLGVVFYIFAVLGANLFGETNPELFGGLDKTMFTLFQVMTLESWSSGIARPIMETMPYAYLFFIPFILIATYTTLNIFIAIVVNTMNEIHQQESMIEEKKRQVYVHEENRKIQNKLDDLTNKFDALLKKVG